MSRIEIDRQIQAEEILVRLIKSPIHYDPKKKKLSEAAFTPPSRQEGNLIVDGNSFIVPGVSLMRLRYTDANTCKQHSKNIINPFADRPESFVGVLLFNQETVDEVCEHPTAISLQAEKVIEEKIDTGKPIVLLHGTPMDDSEPENLYIPEGQKVFIDTPGLPMHADLIYNFKPNKGVPSNPIRQLAKVIIKKTVYKKDETSDPNVWGGEDLIIN